MATVHGWRRQTLPGSLSYAERRKDDVEDALDIDLANDVAKSLECLSDFEGDKFRSLIAFKGHPGGQETLGAALKGSLVPRIDGDGMIRSERSCRGYDITNGIAQRFDAITSQTGQRDGADLATPIGMNTQIAFVEYEDAAAGKFGRKRQSRCTGCSTAINNFDDEIGAFQFTLCSLNANAFDVVTGLTQTRSIHKPQRNAMDLDNLLDRVAGGTRSGADNGTLKAKQDIQQAAFTNIRSTRNDCPRTMTQNAALLGRGDEFLRTPEHSIDAPKQISPSFGRDVFLGKINVGLDMGKHRDDLLLHRGGFAANGTTKLLIGSTESQRALRVDQIHDGLGLGEIHFSVQKGTLSEFPRISGTRPAGKPAVQNTLGDENATVAVEFDNVLTRVTRRPLETEQQSMIQRTALRVHNGNKMRHSWRDIHWQSDDPGSNLQCLRAGNAHHADRSLTQGGGNGGDGVVEHWGW